MSNNIISKIHTAKSVGTDTVPVTVETVIREGIGIHVMGLADKNLKESLLRTITAIQSSRFKIPAKKILINISPEDLRVKDEGYDVAIAVGIIASSKQKDVPLVNESIIVGKLNLDSEITGDCNVEEIIELATINNFKRCILPYAAAIRAKGKYEVDIYGVKKLTDVIDILSGKLL